MLEICELFKVQKGALQGLQESAGKFAGMVAAFCERLGWSDMGSLVEKFQKRVSFGVKSEIVDLTEIPFVKVWTLNVESHLPYSFQLLGNGLSFEISLKGGRRVIVTSWFGNFIEFR